MTDEQDYLLYTDTNKSIVDGVTEDFDSKEIVIPENVTDIAPSAFEELTISKLTLPKSLERIGDLALDCDLGEVVTDGIFEHLTLFGPAGGIWSKIPLPVKNITIDAPTIGPESFQNWITLESVTIIGNLEDISWNAFAGCKNLKRVIFKGACQTIAESAFQGCDNLEYINIPAETAIEDGAFDGKNVWRNKFVDFGLPSGLLWSRTNLEAKVPNESGLFLGWGEITSQLNFHWKNYLGGFVYRDECGSAQDPLKDYPDISKSVWDPVSCRNSINFMPTKDDFIELIKTLIWEPVRDDVKTVGWKGVSANGNSIYFSLSGFKVENKHDVNASAYWTSNIHDTNSGYAETVLFGEQGPKLRYDSRYVGHTIRPVRKKG